jgi:hypothetical protein
MFVSAILSVFSCVGRDLAMGWSSNQVPYQTSIESSYTLKSDLNNKRSDGMKRIKTPDK